VGIDFLRYDREANDVRGVRFSFPSGFLDILLGGGAKTTYIHVYINNG
jgi:hypothetical protein